MASNKQRHAEEAAVHQQEIDSLKARWAADDQAARQAELDARLRQQQLNAEVKEFNRYSMGSTAAAVLLGTSRVSYVASNALQCRLCVSPAFAADRRTRNLQTVLWQETWSQPASMLP